MSKRVAILMGGFSAEKEISLLTGEQIYKALLKKNYDAIKVLMDEDVAEKLKQLKPDVVFIALHGRYGEDGTVQGLLEILKIPYTGSGVMASSIAINKIMTKRVLEAAGISTPPYTVLHRINYEFNLERNIEKLGFPVVVKPACEGSTIGMSIVKNNQELRPAIELAFSYDNEVLVEKFIDGVEITVGILGNNPVALPTLEIVTETEFYDYETKYTAGLSKHIIPARIPPEFRVRAQLAALNAHKAVGCQCYSRIDIIVDSDGLPWVLEINTIPGMTELSLFPDAARAAGYEFPDLVSYIVELALNK